MSYLFPNQPLSTGDLVGVGFRQFRLRWKELSTRLIWPCLFSSMAVTGIEWTITHWMEAKALTSDSVSMHAGIFIICAIFLFLAQWLLAVKAAMYIRQALGYAPDLEKAAEFGKQRKWTILCAYAAGFWQPVLAIGIFGVFAGLTLFVAQMMQIPHLIVLVIELVELTFSLCLGTITTLYTSILFLVVACENLNFSEVWGRAYELTRASLWRGCMFVSILYSCLFLVSIAWQLPLTILQFYQLHISSSPEASQLPIYIRVLEVVWGTVSTLYSMGVGLMASGMFYRDVCMRVEGLDVLDQLEAFRHKTHMETDSAGDGRK